MFVIIITVIASIFIGLSGFILGPTYNVNQWLEKVWNLTIPDNYENILRIGTQVDPSYRSLNMLIYDTKGETPNFNLTNDENETFHSLVVERTDEYLFPIQNSEESTLLMNVYLINDDQKLFENNDNKLYGYNFDYSWAYIYKGHERPDTNRNENDTWIYVPSKEHKNNTLLMYFVQELSLLYVLEN